MFRYISLMCLVLSCLAIYNTQFPGNNISMNLMVGQQKDIQLPITLEQFQSVDFRYNPLDPEICQVQDFDIDIKQKQISLILNMTMGMDVITSYDFLLQSVHLIDMVLFKQSLYLLYSDGLRRVNYEGKLFNILPLPWLDRVFEYSKFIVNTTGANLYLVDKQVLYRIDNGTYDVMRGYVKKNDLTSALFINSSTIAVLDRYQGVTLYKTQQNDAIFLFNYRKQHFGWDIQFVDFVAVNSKTLLILDRKKGVINMTLDDQIISKTTTSVVFQIVRDCSKLRLEKDSLYIACTELNQLNIITKKNKQYKHPSFRIKNIIMLDDKPLIAGFNILRLYNGQYQIDTHVDSQVNKILVTDKELIVGSNIGIKTASWEVKQPTITCGIKRDTLNPPQQAHILLQIVAKCNKTYFEDLHQDFSVVKDQLCMYHIPVDFSFWVGKQIDYTPLKIASIVIGSLSLSFLLGWLIFRRKINLLKGYLMNYNVIEQSTTTDINNTKDYQNFNQQNQEKQKSDENARKSQVESELHDIGD